MERALPPPTTHTHTQKHSALSSVVIYLQCIDPYYFLKLSDLHGLSLSIHRLYTVPPATNKEKKKEHYWYSILQLVFAYYYLKCKNYAPTQISEWGEETLTLLVKMWRACVYSYFHKDCSLKQNTLTMEICFWTKVCTKYKSKMKCGISYIVKNKLLLTAIKTSCHQGSHAF
jgi:hypothetical protein